MGLIDYAKGLGYKVTYDEDGNPQYFGGQGQDEGNRLRDLSSLERGFSQFSQTDSQGRPLYGTNYYDPEQSGIGGTFLKNGVNRYRVGTDTFDPRWAAVGGTPSDLQYDAEQGYSIPKALQDKWYGQYSGYGLLDNLFVNAPLFLGGPVLGAGVGAAVGATGLTGQAATIASKLGSSALTSLATTGGVNPTSLGTSLIGSGIGNVASQLGSGVSDYFGNGFTYGNAPGIGGTFQDVSLPDGGSNMSFLDDLYDPITYGDEVLPFTTDPSLSDLEAGGGGFNEYGLTQADIDAINREMEYINQSRPFTTNPSLSDLGGGDSGSSGGWQQALAKLLLGSGGTGGASALQRLLGGDLSALGGLGGSSGLLGGLASVAPSLAAIGYARNTDPFDTSRLDTIYNETNPQSRAFQYDQNTDLGRNQLTSSLQRRGVSGSSFGDQSLTNFNTFRDLGRQSLVDQGTGLRAGIAGTILDADVKSRQSKNDLYGRALLALSGGISPRLTGGLL